MKIRKHPAAIARDKWLASDEGKSCCDPTPLKAPASQRQYLENRLIQAFEFAWRAAENHKPKDVAAMPNEKS